MPKNYRTIEEFEREELRPQYKVGFSLRRSDAGDACCTRAICSSTISTTSTRPSTTTKTDEGPRRAAVPARIILAGLLAPPGGHAALRIHASDPGGAFFLHLAFRGRIATVPRPMQVQVARISPVVMELAVEVPAPEVKAEVEKAYSNLQRKAHVKGFRPGKAPRQVLAHLYGAAGGERRHQRARQPDAPQGARRPEGPARQPAAGRGGEVRAGDRVLVQGALRGAAGDRERRLRGARARAPAVDRRREDGRGAARAAPQAARPPRGARARASRAEGRRGHDRLHARRRRRSA